MSYFDCFVDVEWRVHGHLQLKKGHNGGHDAQGHSSESDHDGTDEEAHFAKPS